MTEDVSLENLEKEILPFLTVSARSDLKNIALQYICGLTASPSGCQLLVKGGNYVTALVSLTKDSDPKVQKAAYDTLINLTSYSDYGKEILAIPLMPDSLQEWIKKLYDKAYMWSDSVCQLLTNISRSSDGAELVTESLDKTGGSVVRLVEILCVLDYNPNASLHHLASLVSNMSQLLEVRQELMDPKKRTLQKLSAFVDYQASEIRRRGAVGALRNCCFDSSFHDWLIGDTFDVLPRLLLPLAGPEEFDEDDMERLPEELQYLPPDKQRETFADIRQMLVEALIQLCNTKKGRQLVKSKNTYVIMRELHKWETEESCRETIHDLIDILIGDEPLPQYETLKDVEVPSDLQAKFEKQDIERNKVSDISS